MKCIVLPGNRDVQVVERPDPRPAPGEAPCACVHPPSAAAT